MTALELFEQLPEYPDQLAVTDRTGKKVLVSFHSTPLNRISRLRTERDNRVGFFPILSPENKTQAVRLLERFQPYTLIGTERERIQADEMARKHI
jgi:hypothetical protein